MERFSFKLKQQIIAPRKIYVIDHGFANFLSFKLTKGYGRLFENIVCTELLNRASIKHGMNIYYFKDEGGHEVDFVVKEDMTVTQLIQVCYDIDDDKTKGRETKALINASKQLKCEDLLVITDDYEHEEQTSWLGVKKKIKFIPLWKWLLKH